MDRNNKNGESLPGSWLGDFVEKNKVFSYVLLAGIIIITLAGLSFYENRFSERTANIAAAYEKTSLAMKHNAESLTTLPEIMKGFKEIINDSIDGKFSKKERGFTKKIELITENLKKQMDSVEKKVQIQKEHLKKALSR